MTVEQIKVELKKVKSALYKEEAKSAIFAAIFAMNLALLFINPFSFLTFIHALAAFYMLGFFKPTIKKQEYLHTVLAGLKRALEQAQNPPEPKKPSQPWKT